MRQIRVTNPWGIAWEAERAFTFSLSILTGVGIEIEDSDTGQTLALVGNEQEAIMLMASWYPNASDIRLDEASVFSAEDAEIAQANLEQAFEDYEQAYADISTGARVLGGWRLA